MLHKHRHTHTHTHNNNVQLKTCSILTCLNSQTKGLFYFNYMNSYSYSSFCSFCGHVLMWGLLEDDFSGQKNQCLHQWMNLFNIIYLFIHVFNYLLIYKWIRNTSNCELHKNPIVSTVDISSPRLVLNEIDDEGWNKTEWKEQTRHHAFPGSLYCFSWSSDVFPQLIRYKTISRDS